MIINVCGRSVLYILRDFSDMEDAHVHLLAMDEDEDASFFAVYDGHGGIYV